MIIEVKTKVNLESEILSLHGDMDGTEFILDLAESEESTAASSVASEDVMITENTALVTLPVEEVPVCSYKASVIRHAMFLIIVRVIVSVLYFKTRVSDVAYIASQLLVYCFQISQKDYNHDA